MRNRIFSPYMEGVYSYHDIMKAVTQMRINRDETSRNLNPEKYNTIDVSKNETL